MNDSIPTLDYAGEIARSGVRMQEDETGLTISMPPPRFKHLPWWMTWPIFILGLAIILPPWTKVWGWGEIFCITTFVLLALGIPRRMTIRVGPDALFVTTSTRARSHTARWDLQMVSQVERMSHKAGLWLTGTPSTRIGCWNNEHVLNWVVERLNEAIARAKASKLKPDAAPGGGGGL